MLLIIACQSTSSADDDWSMTVLWHGASTLPTLCKMSIIFIVPRSNATRTQHSYLGTWGQREHYRGSCGGRPACCYDAATLHYHFHNNLCHLHLDPFKTSRVFISSFAATTRGVGHSSSYKYGSLNPDQNHGLGPALCTVKPEMKTDFFCHGCQASINKLLTSNRRKISPKGRPRMPCMVGGGDQEGESQNPANSSSSCLDYWLQPTSNLKSGWCRPYHPRRCYSLPNIGTNRNIPPPNSVIMRDRSCPISKDTDIQNKVGKISTKEVSMR
jgi:hypothetical protein